MSNNGTAHVEQAGPARLFTFALAAVAFAGESALTVALLQSRFSLPLFLAGHAALSTILSLALFVERPVPQRHSALVALATAAMGPIGAAGALFAILIERPLRRMSKPFESWRHEIFPEDDVAVAHARVTAGSPGSQRNLASFADILSFGSAEQKLAAVALIGRDFKPVFAPALRLALKDPIPSVRVQAAAIAATLESGFHDRLKRAEAHLEDEPGSSVRIADVAAAHAALAESGLLENERAQEHVARALNHYAAALNADAGAHEARAAYGRLLAAHGDAHAAIRILTPVMALDNVQARTIAAYCEALLKAGDLTGLRATARATRGRRRGAGTGDAALDDVLALWAADRPKQVARG